MKKISLKIAVVVDAKGRWSAFGWSGSFDERFSIARDNLPYEHDDAMHLPTVEYIVEVEVEAPASKPKVVQGKAKKA